MGHPTSGIIDPSSESAAASTETAGPTDRAERFVERHRRRIEVVARSGWLAKGVVYVLVGVSAVAIAQRTSPPDEASPKGALGQLIDAPSGRVLVALMSVGLALYGMWRAVSVVAVDGSDLQSWGRRVGYGFSAVVYAVLAATALGSAWSGAEPDDSSSVESISRSLLDHGVGRWVLALGGLATIAVGGYFVVRRALMRGFVDDLAGLSDDATARDGFDHVVWVGGIVGWIGRGTVTVLVGWFVLRAAITYDPNAARGFDRALREATTTTLGASLVWMSALGLLAYGAFCLLTFRRRTLGDS